MKTLGVVLIIIGIICGLLGLRSYLRDDAYVKASTIAKASVVSAEVKPMSGKAVASIHLVLYYIRDGFADSIEHNLAREYTDKSPLPTVEELKATAYYVRYVPKEKRSKNVPNWVMVSNSGEYDGLYGGALFGQMFTFILLGFMVRMFGRKKITIKAGEIKTQL
ncbi:MAG: hypothetical protein IT250_12305 [Chitinophagaceae bacterium]|nr:hypothetical protein [Chitinophagaceae bacterium]